MKEEEKSSSDWLKILSVIGGVVMTAIIQVVALTWYFGTTLTEFRGELKLVTTSVDNVRSSISEVKSEVKTSVGELKGEIKEFGALSGEVKENKFQIKELERRLQLVESDKSVMRDPNRAGR